MKYFVAMKQLFIIILLLMGINVQAQRLSKEAAINVAAEFLAAHSFDVSGNWAAKVKDGDAFSAKSHGYAANNFVVVCSMPAGQMVVSRDDDAFVLVGGSEARPKVLGYGQCADDAMPLQLKNALRFAPAPLSQVERNVVWAHEDGLTLPILPMVKSVRHQSAPFNRYCPYYIYDDGAISLERCLVGCVATATEQVLSHYAYPAQLLDSIAGFYTPNNGQIPTIPAATPIDYANILNRYEDGEYTDAQAEAVARLSYYVGVACRMSWAPGASGANLSRLVDPLRRAFGYKYVRNVDSHDYSPRQWFRLVTNELRCGRPVVYAGYTTHGGGHAFVVDGMSQDGYFHVTWGYGGNYDGYFDLSVFCPQEDPRQPTFEGTITGLNHLQEALFIYPDSVEYTTDDTLAVGHYADIDSITFLRKPDTNIYVTARISLHSVAHEEVPQFVELFTYTEVDSTGYPIDIDYLGLADGILRPQQDTTFVAYLSFTEPGERLLGVNLGDTMLLPYAPIFVAKANQPKLTFDVTDTKVTDNQAAFDITISNQSPTFWSGRMITYSIFEGPYTDDEGDWRHFTVLNLAPNTQTSDRVLFTNLKPSTDYTFVIRNPWLPALQMPFTTPAFTGIDALLQPSDEQSSLHEPQPIRINHRISLIYDKSTRHYRQVLSR